MLGDSDEIDLTDPLRDVGGDTGLWLDVTPIIAFGPAAEPPQASPAFPIYPAFDFTPGYAPVEEPDLGDDAGEWSPPPDRLFTLSLVAGYTIFAAGVGAVVVTALLILFG